MISDDNYEIVLMEVDDKGYFLREIEKYPLSHPGYIDSFRLTHMEGLAICQLVIDWENEMEDEIYDQVMENYNTLAYENLSGFISIVEKEDYYPTWHINFLYENYEKTLEWLESALKIHGEEIARLEETCK